MIDKELKASMAAETAQYALIKATEALTKIEEHEKTTAFMWEETNRRTAVNMRIQYLMLAQLLTVLGMLFWERFFMATP